MLLAALLVLTLALAARAEARVDSGDSDTHASTATLWPGSIGRANLDGTGIDKSFITGADFFCGVGSTARISTGRTSSGTRSGAPT